MQLTPARTRHRVAVSKVVAVSGQVPGVAINVRHHITSQVAVGDQSPLTQPPQYPLACDPWTLIVTNPAGSSKIL